MIEKSLLESKIKEQGILSVEINNLFEFEDKFIKLENENIDNLVTFAKSNDLKSIFYYYTYYDTEDYMIKEDDIEEEIGERLDYFEQGLIDAFMAEVEEYNKKAADMDLSKPFQLCFFAIYQGYFIGGYYHDEDMDSDYSEDNYHKLLKLVEKYFSREEFIKKQEQEMQLGKQKKIEVLTRLKEYILNDPEFHKCTNDSLRLMYKTNLCKTNKDYSEYHKKEHYRAVRFIDALWKEHKNNHEVNVEFFIGD
mgnify:CR=1 FL=1